MRFPFVSRLAFVLRDRLVQIASGVPVSETDRMRHTYITGGSGSGKSELIKRLVFRSARYDPRCACVVFDPHGDLAEQIAKWRIFS